MKYTTKQIHDFYMEATISKDKLGKKLLTMIGRCFDGRQGYTKGIHQALPT